ncbi:MAG: hypothetical protein IID57_08730 [Proteobacteria bacterium]|nr:hypothetical protein [Pseudomonadota bacterium]
MPEITVIEIAALAAMAFIGIVIGWILRGHRSADEKAAVSAGWQEQIEAQRNEHERLVKQNKGLMEQVNQFQISNTDAKNRAKELSEAVQEAFAKRDELQREIKEIRSTLETAITERDQLQTDRQASGDQTADDIAKDERIEKLGRELENWQNRLPPLIERFRARNEEAEQLEADLEIARTRILELEAASSTEPTHMAPVDDPVSLANGRGASNDAHEIEDDESIDELQDEDELVAADNVADEDELHGDGNAPDNLQQIKGIGPAIEKTLNEMGIFRFDQIAAMSEYEIDRVAQRLKGFRRRIYREDWIGQARELRDQHTGG